MSGPTRLGLAIAALILVWSVAFWMTPGAPRGPKVTFGTAPDRDTTVTIVDPIRPLIREQTGAPPPTPEPLVDPTVSPRTPASPPPPVEPPSFFLYVLAAGDTPETIAQRFYESDAHWSAVARANPEIDFGKPLPIGRVIRVPIDPSNVQGRAPDAPPVEAHEPTSGNFLYTVQANDTLGQIAQRFYGDAGKWPLIRDANSGLINRDGTNIKPGMKITIPRP